MPPAPCLLDSELLTRVLSAIEDVKAGKMVIVVDDEDRENEGDLTMAAEHVTPEAVNFMAKFGRGLICLALPEEAIERLKLPLMEQAGRGAPPLGTAFTVSVEARHGVTTGISAKDRARTLKVAADPNSGPDDLVIPGHVFPLRARTGGVLVRTGQTEGAVDLARLAGLVPAGVICEVMNDDGSMARMPDLETFGKEHGLRIVSIADMVQYRMHTEPLVTRVREDVLVLDQTGTPWRAVSYRATSGSAELVALVKVPAERVDAASSAKPVDAASSATKSDGRDGATFFDAETPVLCRVHRGHVIQDLFVSSSAEGGGRFLRECIRRIEEEGAGVVVYLPPQGTLVGELSRLSPDAEAGPAPKQEAVLREFGLGAQVLADLGIGKIRLVSGRTRKIAGLGGFGLEIVERVSLFGEAPSTTELGDDK